MQEQQWKGSSFMRSRVRLSALCLPALCLLAGCGSSANAPTTVPSSPAASTQAAGSTVDAVASVSSTPIARSSYEHWLAVEKALGVSGNASHQALGFLITSDWVLGEATARHISVSEAEVKQRLATIERQSFKKAGSLRKFLASSGESEADLLARVKVELLQSRISAQVTAGKSAGEREAILASFEKAFQRHWRSYTTCNSGYVMEDCSQYKGKPEDLAGTSSPAHTSSTRSRSSPAEPSASGELPQHPSGAMSITSPAFERNGAIPSTYTCDGANVSPPLQWQDVSSKAAALVLIVIGDSASAPAGGITWMVGDISPASSGVGAGKTPPGAIVGANAAGSSGYGGICPPPGKTSTVEFLLYALSKKIPLSPGFQPAVAEHEYGAGKLLLGEPAITYAVYHRP